MASFRKNLVVKHQAAGHRTDGVWYTGAETNDSITASVQPLKPFEVQNLSEGRRTRAPLWLITNTLLHLASMTTPDIVIINGERYEIETMEAWQNGVINHYKYLVVRTVES